MMYLNADRHPIDDPTYGEYRRHQLDTKGALILEGFFTEKTIARVVAESEPRGADAFYAASTHNVYLTPPDPTLVENHPFNRQVASSKGLIADDQIPSDSLLRTIYHDPSFQRFLCTVLGIDRLYPYADALSSINVHFADAGRELGWHFDNSSFAVTMLLQAPEGGGVFEFVGGVRNADAGEMAFDRIDTILDGDTAVETLRFSPGDLVMFRGRNALHRVTPTEGNVTRMLVVFAYNDQPGVALSESALMTFYGRTS